MKLNCKWLHPSLQWMVVYIELCINCKEMCVLTDLNVMCMLLQFPVRCWMCSGKFWTPAQYVCLGRSHSTPMAWSSSMRYHLFGALLEHRKVCALLLCQIPSWALRLVGSTHSKSVRKFCLPDCVVMWPGKSAGKMWWFSMRTGQGHSRFWLLVASLFTMQMQLWSHVSPYGCGQSGAVGQVFFTTSFVPLSVSFQQLCTLICLSQMPYNISNWPT